MSSTASTLFSRRTIWSAQAAELYRAITLNSSVAVSTILLSVGTNKIISVTMGTEGIALTGVFRTFAAVFSAALGLGYSTLFNQQIASAQDDATSRKTLELAKILTLIQGAISFILILFFAPLFFKYVMPEGLGPDGILVTRVLLFMIWVNVAFQNTLALLRGAALLKKLAFVQLVVSFVSLVAIFPLLKLGTLGIAINIGSGSLVGVILGAYILNHSFRPSEEFKAGWDAAWFFFKSHLKNSSLLFWQSVLVMAALFSMQSLVGKAYGLNQLGIFNAAYLVVDTALLVLMSSTRSYFLPKLSRLKNEQDRATLLVSVLEIHLLLAGAGCLLLTITTPTLVTLLFSKSFAETVPMLRMMSLGVFGFVFTWIYNTFLLEKGRHSVFVMIDTVWITFFAATVFAICHLKVAPLWLAKGYFVSSLISASLYVGVVSKLFGRRYFPWKTILKAVFAIISIWSIGNLF